MYKNRYGIFMYATVIWNVNKLINSNYERNLKDGVFISQIAVCFVYISFNGQLYGDARCLKIKRINKKHNLSFFY